MRSQSIRRRATRPIALVATLGLASAATMGAITSAPKASASGLSTGHRPSQPAARNGYLTGPQRGTPQSIALGYLQSQIGALGLVPADLVGIIVTDSYTDADTGVTHLYFRQQVGGIEVADGNISMNIARDGSVLNAHSSFFGDAANAINDASPDLTATQGVKNGAAAVNLVAPPSLKVITPSAGTDRETVFDGGTLSKDPIPAKLSYVQKSGALRLSWSVRINETDGEHWWDVSTDATDGTKLASTDYVDNEASTHDVFPLPMRSPHDGPRQIVTDPADVTASPFGWNDTDGVAGAEDTRTIGNNVHAATDTDANNLPDAGSEPDGGASLNFDFPFDATQDPTTYRPFAVSNLYYWNNTIHDVMYNYGFHEAAGNFQVNNYGRGGVGNDSVNADAQDGSGLNNANFATPPDGSAPRMQMYNFTALGGTLAITSPPGAVANYYGYPFVGSPALNAPGTNGTVRLINFNQDGCFNGYTVPAGTIALVHPLLPFCSPGQAAVYAQLAGASGVILGGVTSASLPGPFALPVLGVSEADYQTLRTATANGTVTLGSNLIYNPRHDSDLDAEVIVHEYGHGVSNRLTGGPANTSCLGNQEQMGEGWSDFIAMAFTQQGSANRVRTVGSYSLGQNPVSASGFRPTPYSTDMLVDPATYNTIKTAAVPHGVGYVWASALWDLYWRMVDDHGFNANVRDAGTGGNNLALQLVIDGLKLQPCGPGFVDGRDAIVLADQLRTGGANQCAIWQVFARRGLGASASQGSSGSRSDGTEAFDVPAGACGDPGPDLTLSGTMASTSPIDTPFVAHLDVTNSGAGVASNAKLTLAPTPGLQITAVTPTVGTCSTTSCAFGTMAAGASVGIDVTVNPIGGGTQSLVATTGLTGPDGNSANNAIQFDTNVVGSRDIVLTANAPGPYTATMPGTITYTVANVGDVPYNSVQFTVANQAGFDAQAAATDLGSCSIGTAGTTCNVGTIAVGASAHITVTIVALVNSPFTITAVANPTNVDSTPNNNTSTTTITPTNGVIATDYATSTHCDIVDNGTVDCPINVTDSGPLGLATVTVRANHTWDADVVMRLIAPDGSNVLLVNQRGSSNDNFGTGPDPCDATTIPTTFYDGAAVSIASSSAPFAGARRPEAPLSGLAGTERNGTWKLRVTDLFATDTGTVLCWGIHAFSASGTRDLVTTATPHDPYIVGQAGQLDVSVANHGDSPAFGASLVVPMPNGLSASAATGPAGACSVGATVTCPLGAVAAGTNADTTITVTPMASGAKTVTATASQLFSDSNPADNATTVTIDPYGGGTVDVSSNARCTAAMNSTVDCPLSVPDVGTLVASDIWVRIATPDVGYLVVSVVAPDGTTVFLASVGGGTDYGSGPDPCDGTTVPTTFSDAAATSIVSAPAPRAGTYRPQSALTAFAGTSVNGTWNLRVSNGFPSNTVPNVTTLLCWGIHATLDSAPRSSTIVYSGDASAQYSDPVTVGAHLTDNTPAAVSGENVHLTFGTQTVDATTDGSGNATDTSIVVDQAAGAVNATAVYDGSHAIDLLPSADSQPVTIAREDCTVSYTGDTNVAGGSATRLAAQFGELDTNAGDWSNKTIDFAVNGTHYTAVTDATGAAETSVAIPSGPHTVTASFGGDGFYAACAALGVNVQVGPLPANLDVMVTTPDANGTVGNEFAASAVVHNGGPTTATSTVITSTMPTGLVVESATPQQGSCTVAANLKSFSCTVGTIASGGDVTVALIVTPTGPGAPTTFAVSATSTAPDPDGAQGTLSLTVTGAACTQIGTLGNDVVVGTAGRDIMCGLAGNDQLRGGGGNDDLRGGRGNDMLVPNLGIDTVDGGSGNDTLSYRDVVVGGVQVDLSTGTVTGAAGNDTESGIENIVGTNKADVLFGNALDNLIQGLDGDDALNGNDGNDTLRPGRGIDGVDGGIGIDTVNYDDVTAGGVTVSLAITGAQDTISAGIDTITTTEDLIGTNLADDLTGDGANNRIVGNVGNDKLNGGAGSDRLIPGAGNDVVDGGIGNDTANYTADPVGIDVNLTTGVGHDGYGGTDTISLIESVLGSNVGADHIVGRATLPDNISGNGGADWLEGKGGNDILDGGTGTDILDGGANTDICKRGETNIACETIS